MPNVVDLFCGVGGLTHGFVQEGGFNVIAGLDNDPTCQYAYELNNPGARFIETDLAQPNPAEIAQLFPPGEIRVLVGCAPCQPFSPYASPYKKASGGDDKWELVSSFKDIITDVTPEIVSMENVRGLRKHEVFNEFITALRQNGYHVWHSPVECVRYGIPQTRVRLVLLASLLGEIEIIPPTHELNEYQTVRQTIGHLPAIAAGEAAETDPLHRASSLIPRNLQRVRASIPGGTWRDWPEELRLACHRRETGQSFASVYGRMQWDEPSPTMTTECNGIGNGRFGHPEQDRAISMREAALFQTFPETYEFSDSKSGFHFSNLSRHIGNAVPPQLGRVIAGSIKRHLEIHHA